MISVAGPPSYSYIPDPQGKQMCRDWKAGKTVKWPECNYFSGQPNCVKLCEAEKKAGTQGAPKQVFNTLPSLVKGEFAKNNNLEWVLNN